MASVLCLTLKVGNMEESLKVKGLGEALHIFPLVFLSKEYILNRVAVHNRGTFPLLDEHGLDIKPNTATNIAIERVSLAVSREFIQIN